MPGDFLDDSKVDSDTPLPPSPPPSLSNLHQVRSASQQHFYLEPQAALAVPDEGGSVTVQSATQSPEHTQQAVALALGLPLSCVRIVTRRLGGAFGGKTVQAIFTDSVLSSSHSALPTTPSTPRPPSSLPFPDATLLNHPLPLPWRQVAVACALAAQHLHCPVRMALDRKADTALVGGRHEARARYDVGCDGTGRVHALRVRAVLNGGSSASTSCWVAANYGPALAQYAWGALEIDFKVVRTDLPTRSTVRAPGEVQAVVVAESVMDHVAAALGLPPMAVRERNLITTRALRDFFPSAFPAPPPAPAATTPAAAAPAAERVWREAKVLSSYSRRAAAVEEFNAAHVWRKRGLAMAPALYHVPLLAKPARVTVFGDGTVVVEAGGVEMGQGLSTKLRQAAALGLNSLWSGTATSNTDNDSLSIGNAGMTAASSSSKACCAAVLLACHHLLPALLTAKAAVEQAKARRRVRRECGLMAGEWLMAGESGVGEGDVAVEEGDVARWEEVAAQAKAMELVLSAQAHFTPDPSHTSYFTFGAAASEVEVDVLTGAVAVLRADIHYDCARSLNPAVDIGQVEGAFVQGQGYFTTEEVLVDEATGKLLSDGTWAYKVPSFDTVPRQLNVSLLHATANKCGVLSSKSSGEPPLLLAVSIHSAIRHAIAAARRQFAHPSTDAGSA
ncbi:unnamed protein product, partial [Closterium sp. Yama58-4]